MTATSPGPIPPKVNKKKLEAWSKRFNERLAEMLDAFTAEDLKLSKESFGEGFEARKASMDLLSFALYQVLSRGLTVAEVTALAEHIAGNQEELGDLMKEDDDAEEPAGT